MRLIPFLCAAALTLLPLQTLAEGRSIIVLDASGSMWGQIDGRPKLEIARDALAEVLASIPENTELGLIAYGHREKGSCDDIELIVPPAAGTAQAITDAAAHLQFLGKTPLTESVRRAAAELKSTEEKATVILITDGIETCAADPCALGLELEASGVDFTAHVVGFGLTEAEGQQVACLATNTGGQYITAADLAGLTMALQSVVIEAAPAPDPAPDPAPEPAPDPVPEPDPTPAALTVNFAPTVLLAPSIAKPDDSATVAWEIHAINADGTTGERLTTEYERPKIFFAPGRYRLITTLDQLITESDLTLTADTLAAPEIVLNGARLTVTAKSSPESAPNDEAALNFTTASGINTTGYGTTTVYLPAGDVTVTGTIDQASASETLTLAAGTVVDHDMIIAFGLAVVNAYYVEGVLMENTQHGVEIYQAKKALDGSRNRLTTSYGPDAEVDLPPGDYVTVVTQGAASAEVPFTVIAGERVEVAVILNAGVLAITAPGANSIEAFVAKADINGFRAQVGFDYATEASFTLPAGDYLIEAVQGEAKVQGTASVKAGERTEITLTLP